MGCARVTPDNRTCSGRITALVRQGSAVCGILADGGKVLLPLLLDSHIAIGNEIEFSIPDQNAVGAEVHITKPPTGTRTCLYLAPIGHATRPRLDRREQNFVSASVSAGRLGICSVSIPCVALRDYFYRIPTTQKESASALLYETLHTGRNASAAELRVAFKLRDLELRAMDASRAEHVKLERAFNILGHPELRAHYDSLLADPNIPAVFPYGGFGSLLVTGERSRDGGTFFARHILGFVPEQRRRRFHLALRSCDFYADRTLCRDVHRELEFWLDPLLLHVAWDPSWNRWKHLLSSKIEVDGIFVRSGRYKKRGGDWKFVDWEIGLPSRLSIKTPPAIEQDIERARRTYCRFGQYSRALDQVRLCLDHKAIERKDLQQMCSELGIPGDFDVTQISWRPDYDPFFYRELSRCALRIYLFRDEYVFDCEKAVVVETPQLGHATYVFAKPRNMDSFFNLYTKTSKADIRHNQNNIAERLGFEVRLVHGGNVKSWLREIKQHTGGAPEFSPPLPA